MDFESLEKTLLHQNGGGPLLRLDDLQVKKVKRDWKCTHVNKCLKNLSPGDDIRAAGQMVSSDLLDGAHLGHSEGTNIIQECLEQSNFIHKKGNITE